MTETHCNICNKSFTNKYTMKTHLKNTHEERERLFICDACGKKWVKVFLFFYHLLKFFNFRFLTENHLQNHQNTVHNITERNFVCNNCSKTFKSLNNLQTHLQIHVVEKPYLCRYCDKMFARKQDVNIHEKTHTKIRDFTCSVCPRSFSQQSNLLSHVKTVKQNFSANILQLLIYSLLIILGPPTNQEICVSVVQQLLQAKETSWLSLAISAWRWFSCKKVSLRSVHIHDSLPIALKETHDKA